MRKTEQGREPIEEESSGREYESATKEVETSPCKDHTNLKYKSPFQKAIQSLLVEDDNDFKQAETKIIGASEKDSDGRIR